MEFVYTARFQRCLKKLSPALQAKARTTIKLFNRTLEARGELPAGVGFKQLIHDLYEIRVGIRDCVLFRLRGGEIRYVFIGNHDDIRRALKS